MPKMSRWRAACIQMNATEDPSHNLFRATALIERAVRQKAKFIALPENFYWRGPAKMLGPMARETPNVVRYFQRLAKKNHVNILLGSLLEKSPEAGKYYNTSFLLSEKGICAARYRKIHLFKIGLRRVRTDEARHIQPGNAAVTGKISGMDAGLTVCYDIRFPELYRRLTFKGAKLICVPSNFTEITGKAHWEILLRARAIENQVFILAPGQVGTHPESKIKSYGHSLIIDPWGRILAQGSESREEVLIATLDFGAQSELRKSFPVLAHQRFKKI